MATGIATGAKPGTVFAPVENSVWGSNNGIDGGDTSIIDSITWVDPHFRINYAAGLTSVPSVQITPSSEVFNYTIVPHVDNESLTGCDVTLKGRRSDNIVFTNGSAYDFNFYISKTGADYIDPLVVAGVEATVPPTKWQRKELLTNRGAGVTTIPELNFNNLTIGNTYRISGTVFFNTPLATQRGQFNYDDSGNRIIQISNLIGGSGTSSEMRLGFCAVFKAVGTTLVANTLNSTAITLNATDTYAVLEELSNHTEATDWT